jgi:SM-20-related protein
LITQAKSENILTQISNKIFCEDFLTTLNIQTKILPNPYHDYPYMIIKNFLSDKTCNDITAYIQDNNNHIDAKIRKKNHLLNTEILNQQIRKTKISKLNKLHEQLYSHSFLKHQKEIERFFCLVLSTSTKIQALEYTQGSFYKPHSDDSSVLLKKNKIAGFIPVAPQRKLTTVLFTTSNNNKISKNSFAGGELVFNYLYHKNGINVQIKPQAGDMIVFLSNPYFTHEVLEVTQGYRLSLVQWHDAILN